MKHRRLVPFIFLTILGGSLTAPGASSLFFVDQAEQKPARRSTDPPIAPRGKLGQDLFIAIDQRDLAGVQALIKKGADPNARNGLEFTPLFIAAASHQPDAMEALLQAGAKPDAGSPYGTALTFAAMTGNFIGANLLLSHRVNPNPTREDGKSPLILAANSGSPDIVKALIERKVDVNAEDYFGSTPLYFAARGGHVGICAMLLEAGASVDKADDDGQTPLMAAAITGRSETVKMLLKKGAKPNRGDVKGRTALILAATYGDYPEVLSALLEGGANPKAVDSKGRTAATISAIRGHSKAAALLGKPAQAVPAQTRDPRQAVAASLALLQASMLKFNQGTKCISCHHEGLARMTTAMAQAKGFRIDPELRRAQVERITGALNAMLPLHSQALKDVEAMKQVPLMEINDIAAGDTWLLAGMAEQKQPPTKAAGAMAMVLARQQHPDGNWSFSFPRVPMQSSNFTFTALAVKSLMAYGPTSNATETTKRITSARDWLMREPAKNSEDRASRLLGLKWASASSLERQKAIEEIRADQHADGGWAQLPDMASDAYATGQALYALHSAGGMPVTDPVYKRGVQYLLRTQDSDGSWFVNKRAFPANNHFDAGFPHGQSQYASFNGTCWATMAVLETLGKSTKASAKNLRE